MDQQFSRKIQQKHLWKHCFPGGNSLKFEPHRSWIQSETVFDYFDKIGDYKQAYLFIRVERHKCLADKTLSAFRPAGIRLKTLIMEFSQTLFGKKLAKARFPKNVSKLLWWPLTREHQPVAYQLSLARTQQTVIPAWSKIIGFRFKVRLWQERRVALQCTIYCKLR